MANGLGGSQREYAFSYGSIILPFMANGQKRR